MLYRNVLSTFRKKWVQLVAIGIIVILSSATYSMMFYGLSGIEEPTVKYLKDCVQEDFSVEVFNTVTDFESNRPEIIDLLSKGIYGLGDIKSANPGLFYNIMIDRKKAFETEFSGYSLELREYKLTSFEVEGKSHKALFVKNAPKINKSYIETGRKPENNSEIAINKIYAYKNSISIGDNLLIQGKKYKITGFVLMPDYTFPMFDNTFNVDTGLQTLVLATDNGYEELNASENFRFSGIYLDNKEENTFRNEVLDTYKQKISLSFVTNISSTENSLRSGAIYDELEQGKVMGLGLSVFIALIAVIMVSILIYNLIHVERGQIGIIKALGYNRLRIALPYLVVISSGSFLLLVSGYFCGYFLAEPLKALYLDFYLLPSLRIKQTVLVFVTAVFVPLLFFLAVFSAMIIRMLKTRALDLLRPHEHRALNRLSKIVAKVLSRAKGATKFKYLYSIRNSGRFFVFFLGILFSTILINFAFMANGMVDRLTVEYLRKVGYKYESYVDYTKSVPEIAEGEEKFLVYPYGLAGDVSVSLVGLELDNKLYKLFDESGNDLTYNLADGVIITKKLALRKDINVGDTIHTKIGKDYFNLTVRGATDEYVSDKIYFSIEDLSEILSSKKTTRLFSGIYSIKKPVSENYSIVLEKEGVVEQSKAMESYMNFIVFVMIGGSSMIALSILFTLTSLTVENNYYVISLLKVMGYSRREINSMILDSYLVYTLVSYAVSLPAALYVLKLVMDLFMREYGILLPLEFKPYHGFIGLFILLGIFFAGTWSGRRKIKKIPLQEILKTYSE